MVDLKPEGRPENPEEIFVFTGPDGFLWLSYEFTPGMGQHRYVRGENCDEKYMAEIEKETP